MKIPRSPFQFAEQRRHGRLDAFLRWVLDVGRHLHHQIMLLEPARHTFLKIPIVEYEQKRNAHYIKLGSQILIGIDI